MPCPCCCGAPRTRPTIKLAACVAATAAQGCATLRRAAPNGCATCSQRHELASSPDLDSVGISTPGRTQGTECPALGGIQRGAFARRQDRPCSPLTTPPIPRCCCRWAGGKGVKAAIRLAAFGELRGCAAARDLCPGDLILSIPESALVYEDTVKKTDLVCWAGVCGHVHPMLCCAELCCAVRACWSV